MKPEPIVIGEGPGLGKTIWLPVVQSGVETVTKTKNEAEGRVEALQVIVTL